MKQKQRKATTITPMKKNMLLGIIVSLHFGAAYAMDDFQKKSENHFFGNEESATKIKAKKIAFIVKNADELKVLDSSDFTQASQSVIDNDSKFSLYKQSDGFKFRTNADCTGNQAIEIKEDTNTIRIIRNNQFNQADFSIKIGDQSAFVAQLISFKRSGSRLFQTEWKLFPDDVSLYSMHCLKTLETLRRNKSQKLPINLGQHPRALKVFRDLPFKYKKLIFLDPNVVKLPLTDRMWSEVVKRKYKLATIVTLTAISGAMGYYGLKNFSSKK